jgi:hypothetical protein
VTPAQAYNSSVGDTLKPGDTLNSSSFLVSAKGTFALGFFRRIDSTSNESYVGISDMADPNMPFNLLCMVWQSWQSNCQTFGHAYLGQQWNIENCTPR